MIAADAAWLPAGIVTPIDILCGYLVSANTPGPLHSWPDSDWARAQTMAPNLLPIYVPGPGENPVSAATLAAVQARRLGAPFRTLIALDREENRPDLTAAWCQQWHDTISRAGFVPIGYTSASTEDVFAGWSLRWIARPGASELAAGDAMTQYQFGGLVDLSFAADNLPLWPTKTDHPTPRRRTVYIARSGTRQVQVFDSGHAILVPAPGDGSALVAAPLSLPYVPAEGQPPFTEAYIDALLKSAG